MKPIQFETVVGSDRVIRPPANVTIPAGVFEVTIRPLPPPPTTASEAPGSARAWLLACAAEAEQLVPSLPCDVAEHHDHYAHGTPLP